MTLVGNSPIQKYAYGNLAYDEHNQPYSKDDGLYRFFSFGGFIKKTVKSVTNAISSATDAVTNIVKGGTTFLTTGKLPKDFNSLSDFDDQVLQPIKDSFTSTISAFMSPLMEHPALAWLAQAAIALNPATTWLTPYMLTGDLLSMGITLGTGGDLGDALKGAGVGGLVSAATAGIFQTAPVEQLGFIETIKQYGADMSVNMANIVSEGKALMSDPAQYLGDVFEYTFNNGGSEFTQEAMEEALLNGNLLSPEMMADYTSGGSILDGLAANYHNITGSLVDGTWIDQAKEGFIRWGAMPLS